MAESHGRTRRGRGAVSTTVPADLIGASLRRRLRELEQSSSISQEQYEVVAEHIDQVEYEFVAKLSIACVLLACLMVWFAWSFWWDKNMRRSLLASRRHHGQRMARLESTGSLGSSLPPPGGDTSRSSQGTGVGVGYQRDAHAVGRSDSHQQQQGQGNRQNNGQGTPMMEFFNPMWGETSNSRADRHAGFRERSTPPDRGDEPGGSSRNATFAPHDMRPPQQQRRWRAS